MTYDVKITTKRKKVSITGRKNKNETKTNKANGSKQRSFMSAYFSLGAAVGSRKIQSQEPIKSAGEKLARKKKPESSSLFPRVRFLNTLLSPQSELYALVPRSLLRNHTETLATRARNRLAPG